MARKSRVPLHITEQQQRDIFRHAAQEEVGYNPETKRFSLREGSRPSRNPLFHSGWYRGVENVEQGEIKVQKGNELVNRPTTSKFMNGVYKLGGTGLKVYGYVQRVIGNIQKSVNSKFGTYIEGKHQEWSKSDQNASSRKE